MKLTKEYIVEGIRIKEGTEMVIASDGVVETENPTPNAPTRNQIDLGITPIEKIEGEEEKPTETTSEEETKTE